MDTWFTSDLHLGHANIIRYCKRPFADVREMDEALIENWNHRVKPGDLIYCLGDFALKVSQTDVENYIRRLNGEIHLILGNHDRKSVLKARGFAEQTYYKEIKIGDQKIILFHYAMKTWNGSYRGSWQLFGHSHGNLPPDMERKQFDVGVDCWNYAPISFEEVAKEMEKHKSIPVDKSEDEDL